MRRERGEVMKDGLELELFGFSTGRIPGVFGVVPAFGSSGASAGIVSVGISDSGDGESANSGAGAGTETGVDAATAFEAAQKKYKKTKTEDQIPLT